MCKTLFSSIEFQQESIIFKSKPDKIFSCFSLFTMQEQIEMSPPDTTSTVWLFCRQLEHEYCTKVITKLISPSRWWKAVIKTVGAWMCFLYTGTVALLYFHQNYLEPQIAYKHPITFNYVYLKHLQRTHKVPWTCSSQVSECYKLLPFLACVDLPLPSKKWGRRQMNTATLPLHVSWFWVPYCTL